MIRGPRLLQRPSPGEVPGGRGLLSGLRGRPSSQEMKERGTRGVERSEAGREAKTANGMERKIGMLGETDPGIRDGVMWWS